VGVGNVDGHEDEVFVKQWDCSVHMANFVVVEGGPVGREFLGQDQVKVHAVGVAYLEQG
jgi:hypothetical protein